MAVSPRSATAEEGAQVQESGHVQEVVVVDDLSVRGLREEVLRGLPVRGQPEEDEEESPGHVVDQRRRPRVALRPAHPQVVRPRERLEGGLQLAVEGVVVDQLGPEAVTRERQQEVLRAGRKKIYTYVIIRPPLQDPTHQVLPDEPCSLHPGLQLPLGRLLLVRQGRQRRPRPVLLAPGLVQRRQLLLDPVGDLQVRQAAPLQGDGGGGSTSGGRHGRLRKGCDALFFRRFKG